MTKDILKDYRWLLREQQQLQDQLEKWQAKAYYASAGEMSDMPKANGISNKTENYALMITQIEEMIIKKQQEILKELIRIETAIEKLRPLYRIIIREFYINDKVWQQIARETGYSMPHLHKMHGWALQEIKLDKK